MINKRVDIFWHWFLDNQHNLEELNFKEEVIKELDMLVLGLGDLGWELGPGVTKQFSFSISPGGDKGLLDIAKKIIEVAPEIDNWEFYCGRQPKKWDGYFEVINEEVKERIDISNWEYVLLRYDDGMFDIIIKPTPFLEILIKDNEGILAMVIDSMIGEEDRINLFEQIEVVEKFNTDLIGKESSIVNLRHHLNKLLGRGLD